MGPLEPLTRQIYYKGDGDVTEPMVVKPAHWTRRQWREAVRKGKRITKQQAKAEARKPESVKLDERLHAAGLISPRDVAAVRPVHFDTEIIRPGA
jgi:hypothetical protein